MPIKNYIKAHKTGIMDKHAWKYAMPVNIAEACISDFIEGYKDNAKAGMLLVINPPGSDKYDPRTDECPTVWSKDKKAQSLHMPMPKEWAGLYQTT